jgi:hypothetical protein
MPTTKDISNRVKTLDHLYLAADKCTRDWIVSKNNKAKVVLYKKHKAAWDRYYRFRDSKKCYLRGVNFTEQ